MKNRNQTFLVVRYLTWKLGLISDILWVIVASNKTYWFKDRDKQNIFKKFRSLNLQPSSNFSNFKNFLGWEEVFFIPILLLAELGSTLERLGDQFHLSLEVFQKKCFLEKRWSATFCDFQYYKKPNHCWKYYWNYSSRSEHINISSLNIKYFHRFFGHLDIPLFKETNEVSIWQTMPAFFLLST